MKTPLFPYTNLTGADVLHSFNASGLSIAFLTTTHAKLITHVIIVVESVFGVSPFYTFTLNNIDTYNPGVTVLATTGPVQLSVGLNTIPLITPYTPADGDGISCVMSYTSGTIDGSNYARLVRSCSSVGNISTPSVKTLVGATWTATSQVPRFGFKYFDNTIPEELYVHLSTNLATVVPPNIVGMEWVHVGPNYLCSGLLTLIRTVSASSIITIKIYEDNILTRTQTLTVNKLANTQTYRVLAEIQELTLCTGKTYKILLVPSVANMSIQTITKSSLDGVPMIQGISGTEASPSASSTYPLIIPTIDTLTIQPSSIKHPLRKLSC